MKKTLLIAAALVCSGLVQAEQFVCTTHVFTILTLDPDTAEWRGNTASPKASSPLQIRVDTERGIYSPDTERYEGNCVVGEVYVRCTDESLKTRTMFMHDWEKDKKLFNYSVLWVAQNASYAGSCIKI